MKFFKYITCYLCSTLCILSAWADVVVYPIPPQLYYSQHNDNFTVTVRQVGAKEWTDLYEHNVKVDMDTQSDATMVTFDFSGRVEIRVQQNNGILNTAIVRPLSKGIVAALDGNAFTFTLDQPADLSIECNGDRLHNLHLFTNPIESHRPAKNDPNVMYFGAGMHQSTDTINNCFTIPSNTTVYLEGGAFIKSPFNCENVENIKICGRGIMFQPTNGIGVSHAKNVTIENVIVLNPRYNSLSAAVSANVTVRNLRSFSYQGWGDGLDFFCCTDVLVDRVFMRNSDDCIAVYNHRWQHYGDSRNMLVQNSTLWADVAHPINIGTHGNTEYGEGEVFENIVFRNIDILEHDEDDRNYQGCMAINVGDHNLAKDILFEDIRVENIQEGQLFHLRVMYNQKYNTGPGRGIKNVTFRNIHYTGKNENPSLIEGYDKEKCIDGVLFDNIVINGKRIGSLANLNVSQGEFTKNISIK